MSQFEKSYISWLRSRAEFEVGANEEIEDYLSDIDEGFEDGWIACKEEILKILQKPIKNLDLSEDYCDSRYIEKVKEL